MVGEMIDPAIMMILVECPFIKISLFSHTQGIVYWQIRKVVMLPSSVQLLVC